MIELTSLGVKNLFKRFSIDNSSCVHVKNGATPYCVVRVERRVLKRGVKASLSHSSNDYELVGYKEVKICLECANMFG